VLDDRLLTLHVSLGVLIIVLALARLAWRRIDGLPPWSERLGPSGRRLATWTERCLLGLMVVIPATGLVLVLGGEDDLLWLHVAAHVAFFVALAAHVGLTLGNRLLPRML
jgi:cytochrome b561